MQNISLYGSVLEYTIFVKYFGYTSTVRYLEKKVIEEATIDTSLTKLPPTALTQ